MERKEYFELVHVVPLSRVRGTKRTKSAESQNSKHSADQVFLVRNVTNQYAAYPNIHIRMLQPITGTIHIHDN